MPEFLNPVDVLNQLRLSPDMNAADFGCGSGGWVLPLARKLTAGKIYAIDLLPEVLSVLEARSKAEKLYNIKTVCSSLESKQSSTLQSNSMDLILMTNLLFEVEDRKAVMDEGKRVLRAGGKLLVVDWKENSPMGPEKDRISAEEVKGIAKDLDLKLEKEFNASDYHYALVFSK